MKWLKTKQGFVCLENVCGISAFDTYTDGWAIEFFITSGSGPGRQFIDGLEQEEAEDLVNKIMQVIDPVGFAEHYTIAYGRIIGK